MRPIVGGEPAAASRQPDFMLKKTLGIGLMGLYWLSVSLALGYFDPALVGVAVVGSTVLSGSDLGWGLLHGLLR